MSNIIVVLPKLEDSRAIRGVLMKNGFQTAVACANGAQALSHMQDLNDGIVICGYKMADMVYTELHDCLPEGFDMLLLASHAVLNEHWQSDIMSLALPFKVRDLINTVDMMNQTIMRRRRRERMKPKKRSAEEDAVIREAKDLLMVRNHMTEEEAHRYIQKSSMDSGTNMVETAQMVLAMMRE